MKTFQEMNELDKANAWYAHSDYQRFQRENERIVEDEAIRRKKLSTPHSRNTKNKEENDSCFGLDFLFPEAKNLRRVRRYGAWQMVMPMQEYDDDAEDMGTVCRSLSVQCCLEAQKKALSLEAELWADAIGLSDKEAL
jgi:hypothetical protein